MGTTAEKLERLSQTKQEIKQALIDRGVSVSDSAPFSMYKYSIMSIPTAPQKIRIKISCPNYAGVKQIAYYDAIGKVTTTAFLYGSDSCEFTTFAHTPIILSGQQDTHISSGNYEQVHLNYLYGSMIVTCGEDSQLTIA